MSKRFSGRICHIPVETHVSRCQQLQLIVVREGQRRLSRLRDGRFFLPMGCGLFVAARIRSETLSGLAAVGLWDSV